LNEIKYDYVDSKQHFYLQYHVAATDMKALRKKRHLKHWRTLGLPRLGTNSVLIPTTRFSCFCCWKLINYFIKKLIWF